jgi:hypothetical protein
MAIMIFALLAGCSGQSQPVKAKTKPAARDDLVQYATASCLAFQQNEYLKDQGERWAGAVMQNAHGPIEKWTPVADAVKAELARSGVAQGRGEGPQSPTVPLPVMTCGRIAATPTVSRSIDAAANALVDDYGKVKGNG